MPTEDRSGRKQRADFKESLAAEDLAIHGQLSALPVSQQDSFIPEWLFQRSKLSSEVIDHYLLLSMDASRR